METTTTLLLDRYKAAKHFGTDSAAAMALGVTRATTSSWRHGKSHAEPVVAARMAEAVGLDVLGVLAAVEADRARNSETRLLWQRFGRGAFMALVVGISVAGSDARAVPVLASAPDVASHYAK